MDNKEFYADCGFYKDKLTGSVTTLCGRAVGVSYRDGFYYTTDIETGLNLCGGYQNATENESLCEAQKNIPALKSLSEETIKRQIKKFNSLPIAEPDKIVIRSAERRISGMLNYKYFNCGITDTPEGLRLELENAEVFEEAERDMIIDQIEGILKNDFRKA